MDKLEQRPYVWIGLVVVAAATLFVPTFIAHARKIEAFRSVSALNAFVLFVAVNTLFFYQLIWITAALWLIDVTWAVVGKQSKPKLS